MKTLKIYAVVAENSNRDVFKKIVEGFKGIKVIYETNIEEAVNTFNKQSFDLLIIDKALPDADYNKIHKLADMLHPDAAVVALHFTDKDLIRLKLSGLMDKWADAQSEGRTNFIDNPKM